jgi:hypothetical protein
MIHRPARHLPAIALAQARRAGRLRLQARRAGFADYTEQ